MPKDDADLASAREQVTATAEADPYGMTNKRTNKDDAEAAVVIALTS